jgi:hypothetical protein
MDKALVFGTKDCRFEACQGQYLVWQLKYNYRNLWSAKYPGAR